MNKRITNDERAVSGLIGEIMLIGIVIVAIGLITVSTYSYLNKDPSPPHIEVNGLVNLGTNEIHLKHQGGESIEGGNLRVLVNVNGTTLDPFDESNPTTRWGLRENGIGNFDRWTLGDILVLDTWMMDHVNLTEDDDIRVTIVHRTSNRVVVSGEVFGGLFGDAAINVAPIAVFDCPSNGLCEDNVTWTNVSIWFDGSGSHDKDGGIVSWEWEFEEANGTTTTDKGMSVLHTYDTNGTYDVTLTVTDANGETGTNTCTVTIRPPAKLTADAGDDQCVGVGSTVQFDGSDSTGCIKEWIWDFGDGNNATVNTSCGATHEYATVGNYTVNLTVIEDHTGDNSTDSMIVHVVANGFMIVNPADGDWVSGTELIEAHVFGMEGADHTDFRIRSVSSETNYSLDVTDDSGEIFTANTTSYSYNWNTASLGCGNYTINATAYNTGGSEMGTDQITVCVCNLPGMVGFWRFDNIDAGGIADDSSCNKNHGTIIGSPVQVIDGTVHAYQFNGSGDHVEVANSTSLTMTDEITVDAWVSSSDAGEQYILAKGDMVFESGGETHEGGDETVGQNSAGWSDPAFGDSYKRAQTFELDSDATLNVVRVYIKNLNGWGGATTGNINVKVYADDGTGTQPGAAVASATILDTAVSTSHTWIDTNFNCNLTGGDTYWLVLESPDGFYDEWSYYWGANATGIYDGPYPNGEAWYYDSSSWSTSGHWSVDMAFQLNITTETQVAPVSTYTDRISMPDPDNFKYLVYYGQLNYSGLNVNWSESGLEMVMLRDNNEGEIQKVRDAGVDVYYYIVLGSSYNDSIDKDAWQQDVTDEMNATFGYVDGYLWDELSPGYYDRVNHSNYHNVSYIPFSAAIDFNKRLDQLNDHAHDNGKKTVANGVRYYAVYNGSDYYMWESFVSTYNCTASPIYYRYDDFFQRPTWTNTHYTWVNGIERWEYLRDNDVLHKTLVHSFGDPLDDNKSIYNYIASRVLGLKGFSYADVDNFANGITAPLTRLAEGMKWDLGTRMSYDVGITTPGCLSGRFTNGYVTD
ncbi:MAG: PKD domain-containing protein, partial [Euryarchaeota archaeon]|nr:PKD domain-containing protein [Euryarchaeota archaeon]